MDCELCALDGTSGEASSKCAECGEWLCDMHSRIRPDGKPLCPSCFEAAEEEAVQRDVSEDIEEVE